MLKKLLLALALTLSAAALVAAPERWAKEIDAYTKADTAHPPPRDAVVFTGSSSVLMWKTLATDFPGIAVVNRGFGGSDLSDSVFYANRIVLPYHPRIVVLYAGDNDLTGGKTPETVLADFKAFRAKIHAALPQTRVFYLSIKQSPSRAHLYDQVLRTNRLIAGDCASEPRCRFVDVNTPMLDAGGRPRPDLFLKDQLHLNPTGYAIWTKVVAPLLQP